MKRPLLLLILSALFLTYCANFNEKILIKEVFYKEYDGVYFIKASDKSNFDFWNYTWSPRLLSNAGNFYRKSITKNAQLFFRALKREGYAIKANFFGNSGEKDIEVRINNKSFFLKKSKITFIPAKNIRAGENIIRFVKKGIKILSLKIFPKRIIDLPNYKALLNDEHIIFLPAKIEFFIRADSNDKLIMEIEGMDFRYLKKIETQNRILERKSKSKKRILEINLLKNRYQKITIIPLTRAKFIRVKKSIIKKRVKIKKTKIDSLAKKNNFMIILLDAARSDHISLMGYDRKTTPNIDLLAKKAFVFTNAYSQATYTLASTGTLLTGLSPEFHNVISEFFSSLSKKHTTIAELFKKQGFYTAAITANPNFSKAFNYNQGFIDFIELFKKKRQPIAEDFLKPLNKILKKAKSGKRKFFIYLHIREPHQDCLMPPPFLGTFQKKYLHQSKELNDTEHKIRNSYNNTTEELSLLNSLYDENLLYGDFVVGKILSLLKKMGLKSKTNIVIISDHGESLGEHNLIGHGHVLYKEATKIPMILKLGGVNRGRTFKYPVFTSDLIITLSDMYKLNFNKSFSYGDNLFFSKKNNRLIIIRRMNIHNFPGYAIIRFPYKLIVGFPLKRETAMLFNIKEDPREIKDLKEKKKLIYQTLLFDLYNHLKKSERAAYRILKPKLTDKEIKSLKSLGYL